MRTDIVIRHETAADVKAIEDVTIAAFRTLAVSHHTEQYIIAALRAANALSVSLVAEHEGRVVGHIAFSPVSISDGSSNWFGLGPISVLPAFQRQGIGKALIQEGLRLLKGLGARGCCLVGDPNYYRPLGFRSIPGLVHEGVPQEFVLAMLLGGPTPQGIVSFHPGFWATGYPDSEGA